MPLPEQQHISPMRELRSGCRDILPLAVGVAVYGTAFGLLASQAGMGGTETGGMGVLVFAGASQIVATERLISGASIATAIIAGLALNLRLFLMTASLREDFANRPLWQTLLGVHLTNDENWALMHATRLRGRPAGYWYLVGGGGLLLGVWVTATVLGTSFAQLLPEPQAIGMDFAFTAAFIAIVCSLWRGKRDLWPWIVSIGVAAVLAFSSLIDASWALACGGIAGAVTAGALRDE